MLAGTMASGMLPLTGNSASGRVMAAAVYTPSGAAKEPGGTLGAAISSAEEDEGEEEGG